MNREMINAYKSLVGKSEQKPIHTRQNNVTMRHRKSVRM